MRNHTPLQTLIDNVEGTTVGSSLHVEDYRNIVLFTATSNSASLTLKVKGSIVDTPPAFGSAASASNVWETLEMKDLQNSDTIAGDTGYVASADEVRAFEIDTNGMTWVTAEVVSHGTGNITVFAKAYDNR